LTRYEWPARRECPVRREYLERRNIPAGDMEIPLFRICPDKEYFHAQ
jgi:hypothetical protein